MERVAAVVLALVLGAAGLPRRMEPFALVGFTAALAGTTAIAAALIGDRQFTGIEREQKYIDLSIKRHRDILASHATAWSVAVPLAA